ncbi:ABC transporter ATP-binding protein [Paenibacillus sp. ACRRX]|uniref:ABC transporter ATP-binding protein n=1 Tax=Paenibacillus sp. ACRRX TaxID=2918206 RepID=UPI001EF68F29|nr:ABC transporter ATP-binding protein [Paenibacillus sp. ACRRX]MCG7409263.1 ABC transporter ATP-binding protein [Paenibacillus sp. ACRRX]
MTLQAEIISRQTKKALLRVEHLKTYYPLRNGLFSRATGHIKAVDDVNLTLYKGETLGLVGESGCGKSTIGRSIMRLEQPYSGRILFDGEDITHFPVQRLKHVRTRMQMIFQDPFVSLNPRIRICDALAEPLMVHKRVRRSEAQREVAALLQTVGLPRSTNNRYPHELSGGQRQRIVIARAIALRPKLIVCDEPVSALDVSIQAQIMNLLQDLQEELKFTYLFITHGMGAVKQMSTRIAVMYLGKIVELAPTQHLFRQPKHPYTQLLLHAIPSPDPTLRKPNNQILLGDVPSSIDPPSGCRFHTRCPYAQTQCRTVEPALTDGDHAVACHYPLE